jgi:pyridoxal phosphate enzyme (YggS family)
MIAQNLKTVTESLPTGVTLVAVSKTHPIQSILEAYQCGQRDFGENKVQELVDKSSVLPKDIHWHFIGHLQTNKVKYIAPFVHLIHGVDSYKLAKEINKQAAKVNRKIPCLLQFHIAQETSKFGFTLEEVNEILSSPEWSNLKSIQILGVMGMASFTREERIVRKEFKSLKSHFDQLKSRFFQNDDHFRILSFGMSNDYLIAIEEGSTMIRVGSSIFGNR